MEVAMREPKPLLGVIGGTAILQLPLQDVQEVSPDTPFEAASSPFLVGTLPNGARMVFLARHGLGHTLAPSQVPYRANIYGLKKLGVTHVLSVSAVGSLDEMIFPGRMFVVPNQLFDFTKGLRARTFFDEKLAVHVALGDPFCPILRQGLIDCIAPRDDDRPMVYSFHDGGTYVVIEGPQFSTRAESWYFKDNVRNAAVVGMTAHPEASLAREAGLCYTTLCLPADYDAWRDGKTVDADEVKAGLAQFGTRPLEIIERLAGELPERTCTCAQSLQGMAVHTALEHRPLSSEVLQVLGVPELR